MGDTQRWVSAARDWLVDNFGLKLTSVVLAVFLWMAVLGEQKAEVVLNVPLELNRLPKGAMIAEQTAEFVAVKVRGPRSLVMGLAPNEIGLATGRIRVGENVLALAAQDVRVPRGIEVLAVSPRQVGITVEPVEERPLEVIPKIRGTPATGFQLGGVQVSPSRVKVVGPQSEVRALTRAYTYPVDVDGERSNVKAEAVLEPLGKKVRVVGGDAVTVTVEIRKESRE
ncbi:MAG: YbbR-like domain-containing protein [Candidatus Methylomirabilales bacterium]